MLRQYFQRFYDKAARQGESYTGLDAMKLFAVVSMTIDHIGAYLFPDVLWLRALGRLAIPVWFFLVGFSRSRSVGLELWMYAILLALIHPFVGQPLFPLNVLATIILCRFALNFMTDHGLLPGRMHEVIAICAFLTLITLPFFEYGSIAILFAVFGRMVRLGEVQHFTALTVSAYVLFIFWQLAEGQYSVVQNVMIVVIVAWVVNWLARCPNQIIWPQWNETRLKRVAALVSRNTLPYYFWHRWILQVLGALMIGQLGFSFMFYR